MISAVTNSVINGDSKPIQAQVMDMKTCLDKMWLETCITLLYENGLRDDELNLLYLENIKAEVSVKVNDRVSHRFPVNSVVMQGLVWGGLKCTSQIDMLNKIMKANESLLYKFRGDRTIPIGVLGLIPLGNQSVGMLPWQKMPS